MNKIKNLIVVLIILAPTYLFAQNINNPAFESANDESTTLSNIEVTGRYTIITFKHTGFEGGWITLNQSMYLQDAKGETKYKFKKAKNVALRPEKYFFKDNETLVFKAYFQKLKKGTKSINIIERALSEEQSRGNIRFLNFFNVSLEKSRPE